MLSRHHVTVADGADAGSSAGPASGAPPPSSLSASLGLRPRSTMSERSTVRPAGLVQQRSVRTPARSASGDRDTSVAPTSWAANAGLGARPGAGGGSSERKRSGSAFVVTIPRRRRSSGRRSGGRPSGPCPSRPPVGPPPSRPRPPDGGTSRPLPAVAGAASSRMRQSAPGHTTSTTLEPATRGAISAARPLTVTGFNGTPV